MNIIRRDLEKSMSDETSASFAYRMRAESAHSEGDEISAKLWMHIAEEEDGHYNEFKDRLTALQEQTPSFEDYANMESIGHPIGPVTRKPFPQTDADWEDLGFDIEAKLPSIERSIPRAYVAIIKGEREGNVDEAKRWLVNEADKLEIS